MIQSTVKKRSVKLYGHATSITIEDKFWQALKDIAQSKDISLKHLIEQVDEQRTGNLSSALRVYVLEQYQGTRPSPHTP